MGEGGDYIIFSSRKVTICMIHKRGQSFQLYQWFMCLFTAPLCNTFLIVSSACAEDRIVFTNLFILIIFQMGLDKNNCLYVFYCISFATFYLISVKLAQGFHWKLFLRGVPTVLQGQRLQTVLLESFNPLIKVVHGLCLILHNTGDDSVFTNHIYRLSQSQQRRVMKITQVCYTCGLSLQ